MYWPDTNTGVDIEPPRKPVASPVRKFFTEGGVGQPPTVPGGDWFNQVTNELLNVLAAAGIDPSKTDDDQLLQAIEHISLKYSPLVFSNVQSMRDKISTNGGDIDFEELDDGTPLAWLGYFSLLDDGGNTGILRKGTPSSADDGGSLFVIDSNNYVVADMRWPTIRQFGGGTDGDTGVTQSGNLAAMNNILAYASRTGTRVYAGTVKTMSVSAGVKVTLDGPLDFFGTKSFKLTWNSNTDHLVEIMTPAGVSKSGLSLYRLNTDGGRYGVYARAGKFGDNLLNVLDDISITYCKAQNSYLAGHHVYHGQNVDVSRNFYYKCGDNGAYVVFSRNAQCTNNMAHNCRGSAGVVMGYSDTVVAKGLLAANNLVWNDADSAHVPTASASTTLGGVWMGHCDGGIICNNEIYNDTKTLSVPIKSGIWIDENSIRNVKAFSNHTTNMKEHDVVVGITANSKISDVEISDHTGTGARDGVRVYRGGDIIVKECNLSFTTQRGVKIEAGVKNAEVLRNKLKCCGQQETFNTFYAIENLADRAITMRNEIDDTPSRINLVDPSGTVTVKVDPANTNIDVFVSGVLTNSLTVVRGTTLWGDVHTAIIAIPQLSGSIFTGNPDQEVVSIKRTGGSTES
ncbi:right-handed parallel beta-helix repeat-containing protein [Aeromonas caviae]|uniref:right-handed parallel beta-helix repeat-containing protein n=1 Tax=Aeromonas caviae TaxID=648 RepID=UPI0030148470